MLGESIAARKHDTIVFMTSPQILNPEAPTTTMRPQRRSCTYRRSPLISFRTHRLEHAYKRILQIPQSPVWSRHRRLRALHLRRSVADTTVAKETQAREKVNENENVSVIEGVCVCVKESVCVSVSVKVWSLVTSAVCVKVSVSDKGTV